MRRALVVAGAVIGVACTTFGDAGTAEPDAGTPNEGGADTGCATCEGRIAGQIVAPTKIAVANGKLVYLDGSVDARICDVASCAATTKVLSAGTALKGGIAIGGGQVGIFEAACESAPASTEYVISLDGTGLVSHAAACPRAVIGTKSALYFTNEGSSVDRGSWSITRCGGAGCVDVAGAAVKHLLGGPTVSAVGTGVIFTATDASHILQFVDAPDAGPGTPFVGALVTDLATDGSSLFWLDRMGVVGCTIADCAGTRKVIRDDTTATALAADPSGVYWTSTGSGDADGKVLGLRVGEATPITIASGQLRPQAIAVDDGFIYWSTSGCEGCAAGQGEIRRIEKPTP